MNWQKNIQRHFENGKGEEVVEIVAQKVAHFSTPNQTIHAILEMSEGNKKWFMRYLQLASKYERDIINAYEKRKIEIETANDICIGKNEFIKHKKVDFHAKTKNIDKCLIPIKELLDKLLYCDTMCCGIDAFTFDKNKINTASKELQDTTINQKIDAIIEKLNALDMEIVESAYLNYITHKDTLIQLLKHIKKHLSPKCRNRTT